MYDMDNVYVCIVLKQWSNKNKFCFFYILVVISCSMFRNSAVPVSVFGVTPNILDMVFVILIPHTQHMIPITVIHLISGI